MAILAVVPECAFVRCPKFIVQYFWVHSPSPKPTNSRMSGIWWHTLVMAELEFFSKQPSLNSEVFQGQWLVKCVFCMCGVSDACSNFEAAMGEGKKIRLVDLPFDPKWKCFYLNRNFSFFQKWFLIKKWKGHAVKILGLSLRLFKFCYFMTCQGCFQSIKRHDQNKYICN